MWVGSTNGEFICKHHSGSLTACNTASSPYDIKPTDEASAPPIFAAITATCSDNGHMRQTGRGYRGKFVANLI